jgi:hypothetical protein
MVRMDSASVSWDANKKRWVIRLQVGEEVIKRAAPKTSHETNDDVLRSLAVATCGSPLFRLIVRD